MINDIVDIADDFDTINIFLENYIALKKKGSKHSQKLLWSKSLKYKLMCN